MTQLLVSAKNVEEALLLAALGVDIIDLKDPNIGALGALDLTLTQEIVTVVSGKAVISATVGEHHVDLAVLLNAIGARTALGIDIIKIAVNAAILNDDFIKAMQVLAEQGVQLVALIFADAGIDESALKMIKQAGFYGAMLDTQNKALSLTQIAPNNSLQSFVLGCKKNHLKSGLAGSLKPQHLESLLHLQATYLGFRGSVCDNGMRNTAINSNKVIELKNVLLKHNKISNKAHESIYLALHT